MNGYDIEKTEAYNRQEGCDCSGGGNESMPWIELRSVSS